MEIEYSKENKKAPAFPKYGCFLIGCGGFFIIAILFLLLVVIGAASCLKVSFAGCDSKDPFKEELLMRDDNGTWIIAVIDISGIILNQRSSYGSSVADSEDICKQLEKAEKDPDVRAVILNLNTPGGEVTAADDIYQAVVKLKKRKPVIALMNSIATSGGYYVAVACNKIIASRLTMTGSIGVIITSYNYKGLLDKIGVSAEVYKSGEMKDMLNGARTRTPQEVAIIQELVNDSYEEFIGLVSAGRKIPVGKIRGTEIGDGRVLHGGKALKLGLIDQLGRMKEAVESAEKLSKSRPGSLKVVRYKRTASLMDFLFGAAESGRSNIQVRMPGISAETELPRGRLYFLPENLSR